MGCDKGRGSRPQTCVGLQEVARSDPRMVRGRVVTHIQASPGTCQTPTGAVRVPLSLESARRRLPDPRLPACTWHRDEGTVCRSPRAGPRPVTVARARNSRSAPHCPRLLLRRFWIIVHAPSIITPSTTTIHSPTRTPTTHVMGEARPRPAREGLERGRTARLDAGIGRHRTQAGPYSAVSGLRDQMPPKDRVEHTRAPTP